MKFGDMKDEAPAQTSTRESMLPCRGCGKSTRAATLSHYGGRCEDCYLSFTQSIPQTQVAASHEEGPKAWAWRLRRREIACDRLTQAQKIMWREALSAELRDEKRGQDDQT